MRTFKIPLFLLALLLGLSFSLACRTELDESDEATAEQEAEQEEAYDSTEAIVAGDPEIQPEQRVVVVEPQPGPDPAVQRDLEARERQLAERRAEVDARERRVRDQERAQMEAPAPEPEPVAEDVAEDRAESVEPETELETRLPEPEPESLPEPRVMSLPAGTTMDVELLESVSSQSSEAGDIFRARVSSDVTADGDVAIPAGSEIVGVVTEAVPLRRVGGRAKLSLKFTDLVLPSGTTVPLQASLVEQGRSETGRDAATIGGAAAGGAILGRILNKGDRSKGGLIGAVIGAAAGVVIASRTAGEEVTIPEGTRLNLKLDEEVEVRLRR